MLYGRYHFSCVFEDGAILPWYKGSTFRGVFGHALKKVVCALKRQDCKDCLLREKCIYSIVFETPTPEDVPGAKKRIASAPHPYVIEPPETTRTHYKKGEPFEFALLLFGKANDYLPYFIYAFEQMGQLGIGRRNGNKRAGFLLKSVSVDNGTIIYANHDKKIRHGLFTQELLVERTDGIKPIRSLELTLKTPLRLKYENRLRAELPFHVLVRAILRRISSLNNFHGNGEPALDYRGLAQRAKSVETNKSSLRWFDWRRYSNKQDQAMLMGGMVGQVTYSGDLTEFVPLIRFCEKVHLGKQTSFGLGRIELTGMSE
ncbi:MAG: CRISPR system precrRNA processing endoribonuclease RAMP protein Cas6 [Deltaproteobacteria bacterium]|nr:CRISPR system precrRNA processing endoribonuclease RAMP protein Cas6 [Deltaproteobacteria bacterium]